MHNANDNIHKLTPQLIFRYTALYSERFFPLAFSVSAFFCSCAVLLTNICRVVNDDYGNEYIYLYMANDSSRQVSV